MRILIVEDQAEIARFVTSGLEAEHFAVDWAADGPAGLFLARTNEYDLVILDIQLPGRNGLEICRDLRSDGKTTPVIMLTVETETDRKVEALNIGADDYVSKPFAFDELLARIRALLRREKQLVGTTLKVADIEMDTLAHTVNRAGKPIQLNKKEFALLEYFMRNPGITLTRNMILEHVWDINADPFTNTVDVHVRFLRSKMDEPFKRKLLHTVRGFGYKLE